MTSCFYCEYAEDVRLRSALADVATGRWIDIEARPPGVGSITQLFCDDGWSGLNLVVDGDEWLRLVAARANDINVHARASDLDESEPSQGDGDRLRRFRVATLLDEFELGDIHFLRLPAGAASQAILRGVSLERRRPWIVVLSGAAPRASTCGAEASRLDRFETTGVVAYLLSHAYILCASDGTNTFFLADEHASRSTALSRAPEPASLTPPRERYELVRMRMERDAAVNRKHVGNLSPGYAFKVLRNGVARRLAAPLRALARHPRVRRWIGRE